MMWASFPASDQTVNNLFFYGLFDPQKMFALNSMATWINASLLALASLVVLLTLRRLCRIFVNPMSYAGLQLLLEVAARTNRFTLLLLSLSIGAEVLTLNARLTQQLNAFTVSIIIIQIGLWLATWVRLWLVRDLETSEDPKARSIVTLVQFFANFLISGLVLVLLLETFGIQVRTLVAGLGIGGIAVALAVQNVLGDLLAAVSIALDKPFIVGDSLQLENGISGTVEMIGVKTTRLRSVTGELIIVGNSDLQKSRLRNFGRLEKRSAVVTFEVEKHTAAEKLEKIPALIQEAAQGIDQVILERAHVTGIAATGISVEYYFTVNNAVYRRFLDQQQILLVNVIAALAREGIELATPMPIIKH